MSKNTEERHSLLMKHIDGNYNRLDLKKDNFRINELTLLIQEEKRVEKLEEFLESATEEEVIKFFGVKNILESIDEVEINDYLKNYCDGE